MEGELTKELQNLPIKQGAKNEESNGIRVVGISSWLNLNLSSSWVFYMKLTQLVDPQTN